MIVFTSYIQSYIYWLLCYFCLVIVLFLFPGATGNQEVFFPDIKMKSLKLRDVIKKQERDTILQSSVSHTNTSCAPPPPRQISSVSLTLRLIPSFTVWLHASAEETFWRLMACLE